MLGRRKNHQLHEGHGWMNPVGALCLALLAASPDLVRADAATAAAAADTTTSALEEIVVTATRREENINRVPISITAISQDAIDQKGIKDFSDIVRFTPGVAFDASQTNQISIRGISSSGGSGTTGIYIDDTPIQVRNLGFNSDDTLVKLFDLDRVEVLRGPQGTLFGAGSEGGTVRYITVQPSLTQTSVYAKAETSYTEGGAPSYETGIAAGTPVVDGVFGVRFSAWYRRDGGWIDRIDPTTLDVVDKNANSDGTAVLRLAALWQPNDAVRVTPSILYQNSQRNDVTIYWPEYSDPSANRYVSADPTARPEPDVFYLPALNVQADIGPVTLISTTSYFHRDEISGYDGTLYNLGYYQSQIPLYGNAAGLAAFPLLDGSGVHLPAGLTDYRSPASVTNTQRNLTQEFRLQSTDPAARVTWTAGVFYSLDRQYSLEEIHDPMADALFNQLFGYPIADFFGTPLNANGTSVSPDGRFLFQPTGELRPPDRRVRRGEFQIDRHSEAHRRGARLEGFLQHRKSVGGTPEQRYAAGHRVEQREAGHPQSGHRVAGRPERPVLLHLLQGLSPRRRQCLDPVRSHLSKSHRRMHPGLRQSRLERRRAGHLQVRFGAELRGGRQEQLR